MKFTPCLLLLVVALKDFVSAAEPVLKHSKPSPSSRQSSHHRSGHSTSRHTSHSQSLHRSHTSSLTLSPSPSTFSNPKPTSSMTPTSPASPSQTPGKEQPHCEDDCPRSGICPDKSGLSPSSFYFTHSPIAFRVDEYLTNINHNRDKMSLPRWLLS
jgi:hypothetical protein